LFPTPFRSSSSGRIKGKPFSKDRFFEKGENDETNRKRLERASRSLAAIFFDLFFEPFFFFIPFGRWGPRKYPGELEPRAKVRGIPRPKKDSHPSGIH
jgi:hypothetical protein